MMIFIFLEKETEKDPEQTASNCSCLDPDLLFRFQRVNRGQMETGMEVRSRKESTWALDGMESAAPCFCTHRAEAAVARRSASSMEEPLALALAK